MFLSLNLEYDPTWLNTSRQRIEHAENVKREKGVLEHAERALRHEWEEPLLLDQSMHLFQVSRPEIPRTGIWTRDMRQILRLLDSYGKSGKMRRAMEEALASQHELLMEIASSR